MEKSQEFKENGSDEMQEYITGLLQELEDKFDDINAKKIEKGMNSLVPIEKKHTEILFKLLGVEYGKNDFPAKEDKVSLLETKYNGLKIIVFSIKGEDYLSFSAFIDPNEFRKNDLYQIKKDLNSLSEK